MTGLKEMTRSRDLKVGHFLFEFATPGIGHILKNSGCDYVVIDMEHSAFSFETVKQVIRYVEAAGLPSIVRTPSREYHHIARACDIGADGLMVPLVSTIAEARHIIDSMKYHPIGHRGVAVGIAHDRFRPGPAAERLAAANTHTALFLQIETVEGVENADSIAAMKEVDCLWIGHYDLTCSLGIPGQFENRLFLDAVDTVRDACKKHGKSLGRLVPDVATGVALYRSGFDFISYFGDVWVYQTALTAGVADLRKEVAATALRKEGI